MMKKLLAGLLAVLMMLTMCGCGAAQEELDVMYDCYNDLKGAYETCGTTLYNLGVAADSELGLAYSDWCDVITGMANEINENANRMGQEDVDALIARMTTIRGTIDETQEELDDMLGAIDISGRWHHEDERSFCFENGIVSIFSPEGDLLDKGTYAQNGIFVELDTNEYACSGVTDGAAILFDEADEPFTLQFESLTIE